MDLEELKVDVVKFHKMLLLFNAVEKGWTLKKRSDSYVFTKAHEGKNEVIHESYLSNFLKTNTEDLSALLPS